MRQSMNFVMIKNKGFFFGQHPLVEKTPSATGINVYVYLHQAEDNVNDFFLGSIS